MGDCSGNLTRRDFVKGTAGTALSWAALGVVAGRVHAAGSDTLRVGLVGCGGRGSGAARNCVAAASGVKIVALADVFPEQMHSLRDQYEISPDRCFVGLNAYKQLMALDNINLVILATPPAFRPIQFAEAVKQGKNVFIEKPVAVCPAGVNMIIETAAQAQAKGLAVVAGTQRRHTPAYIETMKRIHDGAIGDIVSAQCYWNMGGLWQERAQQNWDNYQSDKYADVEWQIRNWLFIKRLSGDHIVEQHVHNIDVINWAFDALPDAVHGVGGRQFRTEAKYGNIYDHFGVEFVYPGDVRTISTCRQIDGSTGRVSERIVGTKGVSDCSGTIEGENPWKYEGPHPKPFVQEHTDLIKSIRSGQPLNEGKRIAESTLCAIMGRESAYARLQFKRKYFQSTCTLNLLPPAGLQLSDARPLDPVPVPGQYLLPGWPKAKPENKKG
ncbi:Gfo/Idh/MocA family protein [Planctomycetota bacterium]